MDICFSFISAIGGGIFENPIAQTDKQEARNVLPLKEKLTLLYQPLEVICKSICSISVLIGLTLIAKKCITKIAIIVNAIMFLI